MLGLRALKRGQAALALAPRVTYHIRPASTITTKTKKGKYDLPMEEKGTELHPFTNNDPVWNKEMLKNLHKTNILDLQSPHEPRTYKDIRDLPSIRELAEVDRQDNPWGTINKNRTFFDTWQVANPAVPESAETAPNLVSSVLKHDGTCKRFEMNRTEALNALDLKFTTEIRKLIQQWDDAPGILTYMGHTVIPGTMFCPGSDLKAILKAGRGSKYVREFYHGVYTLASVISSLKKPSFMVLDGPVFGNGSAFLAGQFTTTTLRTIFSVPDVLIGFFPDAGIIHKLSQLGEMGRYIALTGRRLSYADLHNLGMAQYHMDTSADVEGVQTSMGSLIHDDIYRTMSIFNSLPIEAPTDEPGTLKAIEPFVKRVFRKKTVSLMMIELQKMIDNPENGEGVIEWAARTLRRMKKASPVSLLVTLEYLNLARKFQFSFEDCLAMDFRLSQRFVETDDYWNGIQVACEKNRSATWSFKSVDDVPRELVLSYFKPFVDPRIEFKPVISRPGENSPDWLKYYNDFTEELTIPSPKPRIFNDDGSLTISRVPAPDDSLTREQREAIPTPASISHSLKYWLQVTELFDQAIRNKKYEENLPELGPLFRSAIIVECFSTMRKFVMDSTDVPSQVLHHANDIVQNIQAIQVGTEGTSKSLMELIASTKDVLPVLAHNMHILNDILTPIDIPEMFHEETITLGMQAYDHSLVEDVDYVSV